ncbi:DUF7738 domain-containing protein [Pontibacter amylolyticus]|uniref:DUF7738 domain-containing protein n=1 Tax=Pontibacter amylolyticus TaxID=1424080 RepID=UPI001663AE1A|nr:hypothetical protein [Pontibacter amylolyticus]
MKRLFFSMLLVFLLTSKGYGQEKQLEIVIGNGILTINGYQLVSEISVDKLDDLLSENGIVVKHKKQNFKDRHHGTRHKIPKYVEIIYNQSGLVFKGSDESKISKLQVNFRSKDLTEKYVTATLEKEYELRKNDPGFSLTKNQHAQTFKDIYMNTFGPWTEQTYSGKLFFLDHKIVADSSMNDLTDATLNLYEKAFFDKILFNEKFSCMIPAAVIVFGFCECSSNGTRLMLFDEGMRLHSIRYNFGQR